jgi:serine/threonine protein phosphatase PrpC
MTRRIPVFTLTLLLGILQAAHAHTADSSDRMHLAPVSYLAPRPRNFDPFTRWRGEVDYDGFDLLRLDQLELEVRKPSGDEIKRIAALKKELGIPGGALTKIISTEDDQAALVKEVSVGAAEIMTPDYDTARYLFLRDDLLRADDAVLRQALQLAYAFLLEKDTASLETGRLEAFLSQASSIADFKVLKFHELETLPLGEIVENQVRRLKAFLPGKHAEQGPVSLDRARAFADALSEIYSLVENAPSPHTEIGYLLGTLVSMKNAGGDPDINNVARRLWNRFRDLLPIANIFYGQEQKPLDLLFLPSGDAVVLLGAGHTGKGSLLKALHDVGMEKSYAVGGEDFPVLFTSNGHLFAGTYMNGHNKVKTEVDDAGETRRTALIRARAFGDSEQNDIPVNWSSRLGKVIAVIDLRQAELDPDIGADEFAVSEDTFESLSIFPSAISLAKTAPLAPVGRYTVRHFIMNYRKFYELAQILDRKITARMRSLEEKAKQARRDTLDHLSWLMELLLNDPRFDSLSLMDKKILATLEPGTELWEEQYVREEGRRVKTRSKMRYTGEVKMLPYGEIQFRFRNVNTGEEQWLFSWVVVDLMLAAERESEPDLSDVRGTARIQDDAVTVSNAKSDRPNQEDRHVNARFEIDLVPNGLGRLLAVMDGHGGIRAVQLVEKLLPQLFEEAMLNAGGDVSRAMNVLFDRLAGYTANIESGTTLSLVYLPDNTGMAHWAVLGDSPVVIKGRDGRIFIAPGHNLAANPEERERVARRGAGYENGYMLIADKGEMLGLQVSGALGDVRFGSYLTRKPFVGSVPIGHRSFVFVGSDGIFNRETSHEKDDIRHIVELIKTGHDAYDLVEDALERATGDNVTAMVMGGHVRKKKARAPNQLVESFISRWTDWKPTREISHPRHVTNDKNLLVGAAVTGVIPAIIVDRVDDDPIQARLIEKAKERGLRVTTAPEYARDSDIIVGERDAVERLRDLLQRKYDGEIFIDDNFRTAIGRLQGFSEAEMSRYLRIINRFSRLENMMRDRGFEFVGLFNPYTDAVFRFLYSGWVRGTTLVALEENEILVGPASLPWKPGDFRAISREELDSRFPRPIRRDRALALYEPRTTDLVDTSS